MSARRLHLGAIAATIFPVAPTPPVASPAPHDLPPLGEHPVRTAARAAEPLISRAALILALAMLALMIVRVVAAWAGGRLG